MNPRPPGAMLLTIGYGAGLATGLLRFPDHGFVIAVLAVLVVVLRREWWVSALLAGAVGVAVAGRVRGASAESCAARLRAGAVTLLVRAIDPGDGTGRVAVLGPGCQGRLIARWPWRGRSVPPGAVVRAVGVWLPVRRALDRPDGTLAVDSAHVVSTSQAWLDRSRGATLGALHARFGPLAPVAIAMLTGSRGELDRDVRDAFAGAGMMHLLTVSGLQIAWLAGWLLLLLRIAGAPRHGAEMCAALAGLAFAGVLGWPAAATRAGALLVLVAGCRWRQRHVRIDALLATSALVVLVIDPWSVAKVGFWLSVLGVGGVVIATRWSDRALGRQWWVRGLAGSTGAVLATAPLAAVAFDLVAPIGIVTSLVSLPVMSLLFPALVATVLTHNILPVIANGFSAWASVLLRSLIALAQFSATAPQARGASDAVAAALPWFLLACGAAWVVHGRATAREAGRRATWLAAIALAVTAARPRFAAPAGTSDLTFYFANVGQGDGALIRTPGAHWIEVDAGPDEAGQDAGRRVMIPLLEQHGGHRIDLFVLSHAHRDHVGGATALVDRVPVDLAIEPGELFADSAYDRWLTALAGHHVRWRAARRGSAWTIDSVHFEILHPPTPWAHEGEDLNEDSIVLLVTYRDFRALLMGDAGLVAESALAGELPQVNVLKVGHHGSRTASGDVFLAAVQPQAAIVSVGRHNRYGHPAPETLARLASAGAAIWRTDIDGTVTVTTDGTRFDVKGSQRATTFGTMH